LFGELLFQTEEMDENSDETDFIIALRNGHANTVHRLLNVEQINVNDKFGMNEETPLIIAALNGYTLVINALLEVDGIDVNMTDKWVLFFQNLQNLKQFEAKILYLS